MIFPQMKRAVVGLGLSKHQFGDYWCHFLFIYLTFIYKVCLIEIQDFIYKRDFIKIMAQTGFWAVEWLWMRVILEITALAS